jgi:hypothetical protein
VLVGRLTDEKGKLLYRYRVQVRPEPELKPTRTVQTYGGGAVNPDPYYNENMVLSDLPAGIYKITVSYDGEENQFWVEIYPGQVTYFTFRGEKGFTSQSPPTPGLDLLPATPTRPTTNP